MPVAVSCTSCGKKLNVKDEYLGKRLKCPGCGNTFEASAAPVATVLPGQRAGAGAPAKADAPRLAVSPAWIAFGIALILIPTTFFLYRVGPGATQAEWDKLQPTAESDAKDVVSRALQAHLSKAGMYNPRKSHATPQALTITFVFGPMHWSMPEKVGFAGASTEGAYVGKYYPKTGEIEAEVEVGGRALPTGIITARGDQKLNVTGRVKGTVNVEIDGKPAEIVMPPKTEEEER